MRKNINLQQFLEHLRIQTNEFESCWLNFNRENKKDYSEYLILKDWFEEFSNFFIYNKSNGDEMESKSHISLEEFVVEMQKKVDDFKTYWEGRNKDYPDKFPNKLWEEDWENSFVNHYDMIY